MAGGPLLSVITPCFNSQAYIAEAIESVMQFPSKNWEHILMDGGSTDQTLAILRLYPHLRVFSEPDQGMYDALNKGLIAAQGEWVAFLNSDDHLLPGVFSLLEPLAHGPVDVIIGSARVFGSKKEIEYVSYGRDQLVQRLSQGTGIINAYLIRKSLFERLGTFDLSYSIAGDTEWLVRLALSDAAVLSIQIPVIAYRQHAGSLTFGGNRVLQRKSNHEQEIILEKYRAENWTQKEKKHFRAWHQRIADECAFEALRNKDFIQFKHIACRAVQWNPAWMARFLFARLPIRIWQHLCEASKK